MDLAKHISPLVILTILLIASNRCESVNKT